MNVGQGDAGEHVDNFVSRITAHLVPDNDVHDANAMPGDARPAATDSWRLGDMLLGAVFHRSLSREVRRAPACRRTNLSFILPGVVQSFSRTFLWGRLVQAGPDPSELADRDHARLHRSRTAAYGNAGCPDAAGLVE